MYPEMEVSKACYCMTNLIACRLIAILSIWIHFISLGFAFYISFLVSDEDTSRPVLMLYGTIITIIVLFCLYFDILLLIGSLLRIRILLIIWLFFAGISMVLALIAMFSSYNGFGICIASLFWDAWTCGLVYGAYSDICKMKI